MESKMIKLTGLWKSKDGKSLNGTIGATVRLVILPNGYKKKDNDPDYVAFVAPNEPREPQAEDHNDNLGF